MIQSPLEHRYKLAQYFQMFS